MSDDFVPHSHVPYGEDGSGFYSDHVAGSYPSIAEAVPYMIDAIDSIPFNPATDGAFTIADFGTADGGTSMPLMSQVIGKVKAKYGKDQEVHVCYEDQPFNDFKSLFLRLQGMVKAECESYLKRYSNVFVSANGTGFYSQCFPSKYIHIGFSATAMHWLKERPCVLKECLHHMSSKDDAEIKTFAEAARRDWECILLNRAKELVPGGHMVIANLSRDEKGQIIGTTDRVKKSMFGSKDKYWRSMLDDGKISRKEFEEATFNDYYRSEQEITAPFKDKESAVYKAGLRLVEAKTKIKDCAYHTAYMKAGKFDEQSRIAHAKEYILGTRVWSNSTYRSALSDSRSEDEKDQIVDEFFARYEADVVQNPEEHAIDSVHCYVHFKKE